MLAGLVIVLAAAFYFFGGSHRLFSVGADQNSAATAVVINNHRVNVEVAVSDLEKSAGLSNRAQLDQNAGLVFFYNQPTIPTFWMKGMSFPIDIIWIYRSKVVEIEKNLPADDSSTSYSPSSKIDAALEVNAGWSETNNIKIGDKVSYY